MHKRLCLVLAVLITPILLFACEHHGAEKKVDPKVLAATVEKANNLADKLDNLTTRAYGMGQVAAAMAAVDPAGASQALDEALAAAKEAHSPANKAAFQELKAATADWGKADMEQVSPFITKIENATTRVWAIRSVAEGMALVNKAKAMSVLSEAAAEAEAIPDPKYRDLDLRGVAAAMAQMDAGAGAALAAKITDPRTKAWALTSVGAEAAKSSPANAVSILASAAQAADAVKAMEPTSELVTDKTKPEAREKVIKAEKAKLVAESARLMSKAALAMYAVDMPRGRGLFNAAVETATSIETPYAKAYAMSDVAMDLAEVDPAVAMQLADKIDAGHDDARFAAMMKAARMDAKASGKFSQEDLAKVQAAATSISDEYDRAKALTEVAKAMVPISREKAMEIAMELDEMYAPGSEKEGGRQSMLGNEVRSAVAVAAAREGDDLGKEALAKITEPRFNKKSVLRVKAGALLEMADNKAATDANAAKKLYGKAVGMAVECKSLPLQWKAAEGLCRLDQDKLYEVAAKIDSDSYNSAMGLTEIAADWSAKGDAKAAMVWDMAAKAANGLDDDYAGAELLKTVASRCAQYDKAKASAIFAKAVERAGKIGKAKA